MPEASSLYELLSKIGPAYICRSNALFDRDRGSFHSAVRQIAAMEQRIGEIAVDHIDLRHEASRFAEVYVSPTIRIPSRVAVLLFASPEGQRNEWAAALGAELAYAVASPSFARAMAREEENIIFPEEKIFSRFNEVPVDFEDAWDDSHQARILSHAQERAFQGIYARFLQFRTLYSGGYAKSRDVNDKRERWIPDAAQEIGQHHHHDEHRTSALTLTTGEGHAQVHDHPEQLPTLEAQPCDTTALYKAWQENEIGMPLGMHFDRWLREGNSGLHLLGSGFHLPEFNQLPENPTMEMMGAVLLQAGQRSAMGQLTADNPTFETRNPRLTDRLSAENDRYQSLSGDLAAGGFHDNPCLPGGPLHTWERPISTSDLVGPAGL